MLPCPGGAGLGSVVRQWVNKATRASTNTGTRDGPPASAGVAVPAEGTRSHAGAGGVGITRESHRLLRHGRRRHHSRSFSPGWRSVGRAASGARRHAAGTGHGAAEGAAVQSESQGRAKAASAGRCRQPRFILRTVAEINPAVRTRNTCFSSLVQKLGKSYDDTAYNWFIAVFSIEN